MANYTLRSAQRGTTLIEILVTVVILSFGLLGIAVFHVKSQVASLESYQRAQAIIMLEDMHARMSASPEIPANYVTATGAWLGTGDIDEDCVLKPVGYLRDRCEWSASMRGAAETSGTTKVGGMIGARGCVHQIQPPISLDGACQQGIYLVTVAWQGMHKTRAPSLTCASGQYGAESAGMRRAISSRVVIGVPNCKTF